MMTSHRSHPLHPPFHSSRSARRKLSVIYSHLSLACLANSCFRAAAFSNPSCFTSIHHRSNHGGARPLHDGTSFYPPYNSSRSGGGGYASEQMNDIPSVEQSRPHEATTNIDAVNINEPPLPRGFTYEEYYNDPEISGTLISDNNDLCAPEINKWTTLMTDGTNAAIHRPGKEMTLEEGMEILYNDLKDLSSYDYDRIENYWDKLLPMVSFLGSSNVYKIKQALRVAYRAHRGQMRKSGEPFIIHPVEVALLLSGMKMDTETVMAGLLHDTVEDTDLTFEQVEAMFGKEVRNIVEGETKVSKLPKLAIAEYADEQAENLRQMFIAMTDDYRIIIVKVSQTITNK